MAKKGRETMSKPQKLPKPLISVLIICICAIILYGIVRTMTHNESVFEYPGSGFPHLSKNQEITRLSKEIAAYASPLKGVTTNAGRLAFENIDHFNFMSSIGITGDEYHVKADVNITKGTCIIKIGNVNYVIKNKGIVVHDSERLVYTNDVDSIRTITFWAFSYGATDTRIDSDKQTLVLERVSRTTPVFIQISLSDGCSGSIGPWMWIRGME
jgi:hypothetical protein